MPTTESPTALGVSGIGVSSMVPAGYGVRSEPMPEPNLFAFATSELSQDAALCWLLAWADPSCAASDTAMHDTGRAFLELLYRLAPDAPPRLPPPGSVLRV